MFFLLFFYFFPENINEVRCFCNLPVCASQNFMCYTNNQTGGCFSEIHHSESEVGLPKRHGCIEFLKKRTSDLVCDNTPRKHVLAPQAGEILVLCCQETICNYQHYESNQKSRGNYFVFLFVIKKFINRVTKCLFY